MIFLKIYLSGVIAGLLFPLADDFLDRRWNLYRKACSDNETYTMKAYRDGPLYYKFLAAFIPLFNFVFIIFYIMAIYLLISNWIIDIKKRYIRWLAGTSLKKHFLFKIWIVKNIFPKYLKYYYKCIEKIHSDELINGLAKIMAKLLEANEQKKESNGR